MYAYCFLRVATALTVYGIETNQKQLQFLARFLVATVPTVYGMRRRVRDSRGAKRRSEGKTKVMRQWYLPFTVLKPACTFAVLFATFGEVATVLTVGGILIELLALA